VHYLRRIKYGCVPVGPMSAPCEYVMSHRYDNLLTYRSGSCIESHTASGGVAWLRRLLCCNRGAVAVEFGLSAPLLLAVLAPIADLGMAFSQQHQLEEAVQAGAQYAATHSWNQNAASAITGAVIAATPLSGISVSPSPSRQCGCPNGSNITTATCGSTCNNTESAGYYVVISAQLPYTPIMPYSLFGSSTTLSAQSMIRIQ
jgi:Flp pilus assembly protein TadG